MPALGRKKQEAFAQDQCSKHITLPGSRKAMVFRVRETDPYACRALRTRDVCEGRLRDLRPACLGAGIGEKPPYR